MHGGAEAWPRAIVAWRDVGCGSCCAAARRCLLGSCCTCHCIRRSAVYAVCVLLSLVVGRLEQRPTDDESHGNARSQGFGVRRAHGRG